MFKILFFSFFIFSISFAQEKESKSFGNNVVKIVDFNNIYLEEDLVYEDGSDSLYTGLIHRTKRNGQLLQEEYVENGILYYTKVFYKGKVKRLHSKYIYSKINPYVLREVLSYNYEGNKRQHIHYDYDGRKILHENFEDSKLIYSCQFNGRKRHGKEFCVTEECDTTITFYHYGKKKRK